MERWISLALHPFEAARAEGRAQDCERSLPPPGAAVLEVFRVARARMEPWQSMQSISTAARASP